MPSAALLPTNAVAETHGSGLCGKKGYASHFTRRGPHKKLDRRAKYWQDLGLTLTKSLVSLALAPGASSRASRSRHPADALETPTSR